MVFQAARRCVLLVLIKLTAEAFSFPLVTRAAIDSQTSSGSTSSQHEGEESWSGIVCSELSVGIDVSVFEPAQLTAMMTGEKNQDDQSAVKVLYRKRPVYCGSRLL